MDAAQVLHFLLMAWLVTTSLLAILYLRARLEPSLAFFLWGLVACFPGLGPVVVFWVRPGRREAKA